MYNLTDLANKIIQVASQFAAHRTNEVGTEHILYALTKVESKAKKLLQNLQGKLLLIFITFSYYLLDNSINKVFFYYLMSSQIILWETLAFFAK